MDHRPDAKAVMAVCVYPYEAKQKGSVCVCVTILEH